MDRGYKMTIEWSKTANRDIGRIEKYLINQAGERRARKTLNKIYGHVDILIENPRAGQFESMLDDQPIGYRRLVEGNYKILYYIKSDRVVRIAAVFDCRRDPAKMKTKSE